MFYNQNLPGLLTKELGPVNLVVEGLTGKICTFLLADLWLRYYHDMTV